MWLCPPWAVEALLFWIFRQWVCEYVCLSVRPSSKQNISQTVVKISTLAHLITNRNWFSFWGHSWRWWPDQLLVKTQEALCISGLHRIFLLNLCKLFLCFAYLCACIFVCFYCVFISMYAIEAVKQGIVLDPVCPFVCVSML